MKGRGGAAFLTGATGLVGSYFLHLFLNENRKVFCLVRSEEKLSGRDRVLRVLKFWRNDLKNLDNLIILDSDLQTNGFGLSGKNLELFINQVGEVYHCAAQIGFHSTLDELLRINVGGSEAVFKFILDMSVKFKRQIKINYISTVYVCGTYRGVFSEAMRDVNQGFEIPYERSKFEAEKMVDSYRAKGLWIDIFRLPAVLGESFSGKVLSFNQAFYQALHLLNTELFEFLPCKSAHLSAVFVDELCRSINKISTITSNRNICYHVFGQRNLSIEEILLLACDILNIKKPQFVSADDFLQNKVTPIQKKIMKYNFLFLTRDVHFNSTDTNAFLIKNGFEFSSFEKKHLLPIIEYAKSAGFLKVN